MDGTDRYAGTADAAANTANTTGYLLLSASVDGHAGPPSEAKQELINALKASAGQLRRDLFANVGVLTARRIGHTAPTGDRMTAAPIGDPIVNEPPGQSPAGPSGCFDVAVLLQAPSVEAARWLTADPAFIDLHGMVALAAHRTHVAVIHNVRRNHCEYGAQSRRLYVLMNYLPGDEREVVPAWGWTHRRELLADLVLSSALRRFRQDGARPAQSVLYALA